MITVRGCGEEYVEMDWRVEGRVIGSSGWVEAEADKEADMEADMEGGRE
jgi:hypothetical protein